MSGKIVRFDGPRRRLRSGGRDFPVAPLARAGACLALILLCGCAGESEYGARAFAVQGKHDWRSCDQLVAMHGSMTKQIDDLRADMEKASRDGGGGFVNATVYGPTLLSLQADRRLLQDSIDEKNCTVPASRGR